MKLLVVEDEERMAQLLYRGLVEEGHGVDLAMTSESARARIAAVDYDVIVLDWGLPDEDGLALLESLRAHGFRTPVLMLTARGTVQERVLGLKRGADDYLAKPFDFEELLARVNALHRRSSGGGGNTLSLGDVSLSRSMRQLVCGARRVDLTQREFQLFCALADRMGETLTRSELLSRVWGEAFEGGPNVVDVYAGYLREKLRLLDTKCVSIATVRGMGFRVNVRPPEHDEGPAG
jgi:two-component system, OmpR family, response regulator